MTSQCKWPIHIEKEKKEKRKKTITRKKNKSVDGMKVQLMRYIFLTVILGKFLVMSSFNSEQLHDKLPVNKFLQFIVTCYTFGATFVARQCKTACSCWTNHCLLKSIIARVVGQKHFLLFISCVIKVSFYWSSLL